jgi:putative ABC transport system permease protein
VRWPWSWDSGGRRIVRRAGATAAAARAATTVGLPVAAVCGVRFALDPGRGRQAAPVRSAVVGAVVAVAVVVATLTVGASMDTLASRPSLYGWNWTVGLDAAGGVGVLPEAATAAALNADPDVAAWSGMDFGRLQIDGRTVPVLGVSPRARVGPALLSGHGVDAPGQIVLGSATLQEFHLRVGGTSTALRIVGTATLPAIGGPPHTEMGTGAVVDYHLIPASERNLFNLPGGGPNIVFVRLKGAADRAAMRRLDAVAAVLTRAAQDNVQVVPVQRPAEIASVGTLRTTPSVLAFALALGAILALGLTLVASVRRRRRDLAMLKVLGFTRRQLSSAVAWQSTVSALIGVVVGIPVGVVGGRALWTLFARGIHAVPAPSVPVAGVALVALGAVMFANLLAIAPGRVASKTPSAIVLRAE